MNPSSSEPTPSAPLTPGPLSSAALPLSRPPDKPVPAPASPRPHMLMFLDPVGLASYESLRRRWRAIRDLLAERPQPSLYLGSQLSRCDYQHYLRLVPFIEQQAALLEQADATGDWTPVEKMLFAKYGDYHLNPRFQQVVAKFKKAPAPAGPLSPTDPAAADDEVDDFDDDPPPPTQISTAHLKMILPHSRDIELWMHLGYALHGALSPAGLNRFLAGTGLEEATPAAPGADPKKAPPESIMHPSQRERCLCLGFIAEQCFTAQGRARLLGTGI